MLPENFARNPAFVEFLHGVVGKWGHTLLNVVSAARQQKEGWIDIIDGRTPTPQDAVPPEDIVGAFQVAGGNVVPGSYQRNPHHRILTPRGFFQLQPLLQEHLLREIAQIT